MKEKAINKVTLSNLNEAYQVARKIMDASDQANIGLVGYLRRPQTMMIFFSI